jgi:ABC-type transport system involved in multi-copper enzyme maturation permease subunit
MYTLVIARLTFLEAMRRRILLAALVLGILFLIVYGIGFYYIHTEAMPDQTGPTSVLVRNQIYNFLLMAGLFAINFLTLAMGALVSADTLAGEIGSGAIQTIVTKPVRRVEIVLGKWLGFTILIGLYLLLMLSGIMSIVYAIAGYVAPNIWRGAPIIYLETVIVMTITLACSSTFSTLATGGIVFGLYGLAFIGGFVEQIGALLKNQTAINLGIVSSLIMPSEALLRRAGYEMTTPVAQSLGIGGGPLVIVSVPSMLMVAYGAAYLVVMLLIAFRQFNRRDL